MKLSPLGKGFYSLKFSCLHEKNIALSKSSCKLPFGSFKFFTWKFDFNPSKKFSFTHLWVRFNKLPIEYWHPHILFTIANGIGVPISIHNATLGKAFGFYAKVLVEVDLSSPLPTNILIERNNFSFVLNLSYEHTPLFCKFCGIFGHNFVSCKYILKTPSNASLNGSSKDHTYNSTIPSLCVSEVTMVDKKKKRFIEEEKKHVFANIAVCSVFWSNNSATIVSLPSSVAAEQVAPLAHSSGTAAPATTATTFGRQSFDFSDFAKHHTTSFVSSSGSDKKKKNHHGGNASAEPLSFSGEFNAPAQVSG